MAEIYASGSWHVTEGKEEEFVERWTEFLRWTREARPGLEGARLIRDEGDPRHFVSLAEWADADSRAGWRDDPGFAERMKACRALCDDFYGNDYRQTVTI